MHKEKTLKIVVWLLSITVAIESISLVFLWSRRPKEVVPVFRAKIAIVIDDWGYNLENIPTAEQLNYPLTAAILPNLNYSRTVAEKLQERGFEIILHLPMEPKERYRLEKNTVLTSLGKTAISRIIEEDLASIAFARGVSNHMGSRATEDRKTMEVVFTELKKKGLYFLDSFVTSKSVCLALARKVGLPFARRDIFLDNKDEPNYIRQQINKLKLRAKANGAAIGIGHDRKITLDVLKELMPQLEKEGYKLVFLSELVR